MDNSFNDEAVFQLGRYPEWLDMTSFHHAQLVNRPEWCDRSQHELGGGFDCVRKILPHYTLEN